MKNGKLDDSSVKRMAGYWNEKIYFTFYTVALVATAAIVTTAKYSSVKSYLLLQHNTTGGTAAASPWIDFKATVNTTAITKGRDRGVCKLK